MTPNQIRIAVYSLDLPQYACAQLRVVQPATQLAGQVRLDWAAQSNGNDYAIRADAIDSADLILIQRTFPQAGAWPLVEKALASGKPVLYDIDDLLLDVPEDHPLKKRLQLCVPFVRELLARADLTTVSTPTLAAAVAPLAKKVLVLANRLPDALWRTKAPAKSKQPGRLRIGFAGTASHQADLALIEDALLEIAAKHHGAVEFVFYGCATPRLRRLNAAVWRPFGDDYAAYCRALPRLGLHIGLGPLRDTPFNRCKSNIKWQEYAACGLAGIFSDLEPYRDTVEPDSTGMLCANTAEAWFAALDHLISDPMLCHHIGRSAYAAVMHRFCLSRCVADYLKAWTYATASQGEHA